MASKSNAIPGYKVIVVGAGGAGKSALTQMFMYNNFVEEYDPTTADSYRKLHEVDGVKCQLDILDTAGQEEYMRDNYYKLGEGFLIVYSITMRESFRATNRFYDHILNIKETGEGEVVPIIIVGSKCDLDDQRDVTTAEGEELAEKLKVPFYETSAKTRHNVDEVFTAVLKMVIEHRKANGGDAQPQTSSGGGCCV
eukprot:CAMPEP_0174252350 /NCGR_PEP_ID=MMETSP0439-20130205/1860_1 /TAXON_ID=0 /ORGANISM="Stereomyxa ramosa, Strain Chinc5" /LENGTH=195 /DNA_ID=CAMNT_0015332871 /DNA_START=89 /DNA_END=672 /DNA_ORIENTATION=+